MFVDSERNRGDGPRDLAGIIHESHQPEAQARKWPVSSSLALFDVALFLRPNVPFSRGFRDVVHPKRVEMGHRLNQNPRFPRENGNKNSATSKLALRVSVSQLVSDGPVILTVMP